MTASEPGADEAPHEQLALTRAAVRRAKPPRAAGPAPTDHVARVLVDVGLPHLDRPFDYLVTEDQHADAVAGCRVKVRFAGQEVAGFVLERTGDTAHTGRLAPLRRVVSAVPVLTPEVAALCREVADREAGVLPDVLRLAVPPRHARVEQEARPAADAGADPAVADVPDIRWGRYQAGKAYLDRLRRGLAPRAVWCALPGPDWVSTLADAVLATRHAGRGSVVCLPDHRDVRRLAEELTTRLGEAGDDVAVFGADLGPAARYRAYLRVLEGRSRIVVGSRSAAFAPVHRLGLVAVWDDGDDLHAEPRAPYPHVRDVLATRARLQDAALLVGGHARTAEGQQMVASGWAHPLVASRADVRERAPRVHVTGESDHELDRDPAARRARLPHRAMTVARSALEHGPVLVQVPRGGYLASLACVRCRHAARCGHCQGPLAMGPGQRHAGCRWCGRVAEGWSCPRCGADRFRAPVVGAERTAEELGRAFPQVPVVRSAAGQVQERVGQRPSVVVATPGAEPVADGAGYAAALLLDTWLVLARPDLRTAEESVRRWLSAAALVRPAGEGGTVVLVGDPAAAPVQSVVRWDPGGAAERELAERAATGLPPASRVVAVSGPSDAVAAWLRAIGAPPGAETLGPIPVDEESARAIVRVPREAGAALARAVKQTQATRSARKQTHLRVELDPLDLG